MTADSSASLTGFPTLKPAFVLKVNVGDGNPVGDTVSGSQLVHWQTPSGTLTTVEGFEPKVEADIVFGADWLYIDADKKYARPDLKCIGKTKDGHTISMDYTGIAQLAKEFVDIFGGHPDAKTIPFGLSVTEHRFQTGAQEYKFLENSKWVGNGRFVVGNNPRTVTVESRISQVVASTDAD